MADINLLPDDLRKKETKERSTRPSFNPEQKLVVPADEEKKKETSLWSRFGPHKSEAKPITPDVSAATKPTETVSYRPVVPVAPVPKQEAKPDLKEVRKEDLIVSRPQTAVVSPSPAPVVEKKPTKSDIPAFSTEIKKPKVSRRPWKLFGHRGNQKLTAGQAVSHGDATLDVNLIPSELSRRPELDLPRKFIISGVCTGVTLIVIIAIYLGITWYQLQITRDIESLQSEITSLDSQIAQLERDKNDATTLQQQLQATRMLLDKHVYWTKFFDLLANHTAPDVYYTNFSMTGRDKLVISAVAKDYKAIARQLTIFQEANDFIKHVRIDAASAVIDQQTGTFTGVSFTINLEFVPDIFFKPLE